jgi:diketogulonate reductase-like aldo/keto reductase
MVVAHSPLAKGEKLDNPILKSISKDINKTPSQIMLKWNYINNNIIIPRSKDQLHILENTSLDFELSKDNLEKLDSLNCNYSTHPKYL